MKAITESERKKVASELRARGFQDWDIAFSVSISDLCRMSYQATGKTLTKLLTGN